MSNMYRTNIAEVPKVEGLKRKDGWIDMQVQFLIDKRSAGADHVVGWSVLKPGASHERHLHRNCDEFFIVLKGKGHIITDKGMEPSAQGDVVYSPRNPWRNRPKVVDGAPEADSLVTQIVGVFVLLIATRALFRRRPQAL